MHIQTIKGVKEENKPGLLGRDLFPQLTTILQKNITREANTTNVVKPCCD